jgi:hypothetical protein
MYISIPLYIATIFNCSISSSTLPDKFKIASVIPVHKQGSQLIPNNYQPISLLSIFNGLLERLVRRRLKDFVTKPNLLYEKKFGFRSNHSTLIININAQHNVRIIIAITRRNFHKFNYLQN